MIGILILSHGPFGENLIKTACGIVDDPGNVLSLNLSRRLDTKVMQENVSQTIKKMDSDAGVLVLIDAYGGTSYNTTFPLLKTHSICIVTGVNLPMLLSALTNRHRMFLSELSRKVAEDAKKTISVVQGSDLDH